MIVADTHALIGWVNGDGALSADARAALAGEVVIVATAIDQRVPLVTKDARIRVARVVPTIW